MASSPSSPPSGGGSSPQLDLVVTNLFDCLRLLKKAEAEANTPYGRGDPVLATRIKELRSYKDVLLKQVAGHRPKVTVTEKKGEEASHEVEVVFPSGLAFYEALELSLSKGGLFIKTEQILPIDTVLDLKVLIEEEQISFTLQGKVVWINPRDTQGRPAGMGLKLPKISSAGRQLLLDFLAGEVPVVALAHLGD